MASRSLGVLTLDLAVRTGMFVAGMNRAERETSRAARSIEQRSYKMGKALGTALKAVAGAAPFALYIKNTIEAEKVQAQLLSRIKDTGAAAGRSIEQLNDQAEKLSALTVFDDESIGNAQALLLTFKEIRGIQFDKAVESVLDLSTAMGTDLNSAALQVGKALNDPIAGIGALSRAGVQFTKDQKEVIKALVESGDKAKAQEIILGELASQMGTAAEAARNTLGGAIQGLLNDFNNMLEGDARGGGLNEAVDSINELSAVMRDPQTQAGFDAIASGVASVTAQVVQGIAILANYIQQFMTVRRLATTSGKNNATYDELNTRLAEVSTDISNIERGGVIGLGKSIYRANSTLTQREKMTSFPGDKDTLARLKKEREQIVRQQSALLRSEMVEAGVAVAFDGLKIPGISVPGVPKVSVCGTRSGGRSVSGGSSRVAPELPDFMAKDREALAEAIQREAEMVERANTAYLDMAASYGGPLAEAQREHIKNLIEIAEVGKAAMRTPEEIKALSDAEVARYEANVKGIEGMSDAMQEHKAFMDGIRGTFNDFFMDVFTGTKSIGDAFKDLFDNIAAMITQRIVNGWLDKLFGAPGTTGAGSGGGDFFSSLLGMFGFGGANANGNAFSGGNVVPFANGGIVSAPQFFPMAGSRMGLMGEAGPEAIMPLARVNGKLGVRMSGSGGGIVQNVYVQGRPDKSTLKQMERASGRGAAREMSRTGR